MSELKNEMTNNSMIRILTLGNFKILLENSEIYTIPQRSNKLWNLFKLLLINVDKALPQEVILEQLYPEKYYEDPQNAVQNMIYRLRKLLNNITVNGTSIKILFSEGCYRLDTQSGIWSDFKYFEELVKKAELLQNENYVEAIQYYKDALEIYTGELLPELIFEDWVIIKRTSLNNLYIKSVLKITELYKKINEYDEIVHICRKALLIEPYQEEVHIQLIENLLNQGKVKDAKKHYEEMVRIFIDEFGIKPTKEMQRIHEMLKTEYVVIESNDNNTGKFIKAEDDLGAFFCEYRDFYVICTLEKRRYERTGEAFCPISVIFDNNNKLQHDDFKNNAFNEFKTTLINSLRKGDLVTLINNTQFIVMLPNSGYKQVKFVIDRVISKFKDNIIFEDIDFNIGPFLSLPKKIS